MAKQITSEEELNAQIAAIEEMKKAAIEQFKTVKSAAIDAAVKKAGAGVQKDFKEYKQEKERVEELKKTLNEKLEFLSSKHKSIRDALVAAGAKESYLEEFLGAAPKAKAVKAAGTGTGGTKVHQNLYNDKGEKVSWVDFGMKVHSVAESELRGTGINARRVLEAKGLLKSLPSGYQIKQE